MKLANWKPRPPPVLTCAGGGRGRRAREADERARELAERIKRYPPLNDEHPRIIAIREQFAGARFKLGPMLGHGASGAVFDSTDETTGQRVAVKVYEKEHADQAGAEHDALALLDHPGVIKPVAHGRVGDRAFLASELVVGSTLMNLLAKPGPHRALARHLLACARAMDHCHARGVAGGGCGPQNTMITATGAKLIDFAGVVMRGSQPERFARRWAGDVQYLGGMLHRCVAGERDRSGDLTSLITAMGSAQPPTMADVANRLDAIIGGDRTAS